MVIMSLTLLPMISKSKVQECSRGTWREIGGRGEGGVRLLVWSRRAGGGIIEMTAWRSSVQIAERSGEHGTS